MRSEMREVRCEKWKALAGYEASPHAESRLHVRSANADKNLTSNLSHHTSQM